MTDSVSLNRPGTSFGDLSEKYPSHSRAFICTTSPSFVPSSVIANAVPQETVDASASLAIVFPDTAVRYLARPMSRQRYAVYYSGDVQGVGFRYTACRLAQSFNITGFVRNLPDGRVQLLAEGPSDQLDRFLEDLASDLAGYIRSRQLDRQEVTREFTGFSLRR